MYQLWNKTKDILIDTSSELDNIVINPNYDYVYWGRTGRGVCIRVTINRLSKWWCEVVCKKCNLHSPIEYENIYIINSFVCNDCGSDKENYCPIHNQYFSGPDNAFVENLDQCPDCRAEIQYELWIQTSPYQ